MKITESALKRIIREELKNTSKNIAEAIEPGVTFAKGRPNLKSEYTILNVDQDINKIKVKVKAYGSQGANHPNVGRVLSLKDVADNHPLKVNVKKLIDADASAKAEKQKGYDDERAEEKAKGPIEARVIKMLQFYDTAVYGKSLGPFISKYNSLPGGPLFIRAGARFAGDLGMLDEMPTNLKGLKAVSRRFLPETGDDFVDEALVIAHRLVKDLDFKARSELASMLIRAMTGGLTLEEINDAITHMDYLQDRVKSQFTLYRDDTDRKKARTINKQQRAMEKLLKQVKKRGPAADVVLQDLDGDQPRKLPSGNVLSRLITPNETAADISKTLQAYNRLLSHATGAADSMLDGASRLHQMMKEDPDAAEYIKQFILFNTGQ